MRFLFRSAAAAVIAGSLGGAAPADASDRVLNNVINQAGRYIRDEQRYRSQERRDSMRHEERMDRNGINRSDDCESNQIRARGQDYRYTGRASAYQACDGYQGGRYGGPSSGPYAREQQMYNSGEIAPPRQLTARASSVTIDMTQCFNATEARKTFKLCPKGDGTYIKVAPTSGAAPGR